ncbi:Rox3-domain-containing protein [Dothidotthia symphoricarpi CBS 119687]|uniref:Mediator of RNA polymerase II transcription subunit 19 n=1 Tax=Dothidotthia symphoricarpi CBS 119687 TaxID=1392245 RepID=A0A6A6AKH2_9PLEO|nr:Rox3-domain-containing protein [Dothidotthia symphoricarpi CBS 119687]KAF2131377.1 Rox3-domain-containing protein [Dothidotthia symphoricarpi CBS 119687]
MSDHSAKRQRLGSDGRFSPASPSFDIAAKAGHQTKLFHPRTPTSPPYFPMNPQSNGDTARTTTAASSEKTSPSSAPMSRSLSQSATSATSQHPFPTPASTAGPNTLANLDSDGDAIMGDGVEDDATRLGRHRLSNHNRQGEAAFSENGGLKAAEGVSGSQLFKTTQTCHTMSRPHGSQNLFQLYGLETLARSVARTDPVTGEKINKLRKSYEGHIKSLQIAGKPKAAKMDGAFSGLMHPVMPDEIWLSQKRQGKEVERALGAEQTTLNPDFSSLLDGALAGMAPGSLPNADTAKYRAYIGTDDMAKPKPSTDGPAARGTPLAASTPTPHTTAAARAFRPERAGSKRHYTDATFQGYSEGFNDEFGADSTGGEDNGQSSLAKRRKLQQFERTSHSVEVGGTRR